MRDSSSNGISIDELSARFGGRVRGEAAPSFVMCCEALAAAGSEALSFLANPRYVEQALNSKAGCILVSEELAGRFNGRVVWVHDDPYFAFRQAMTVLHGFRPFPQVGIDPASWIDDTAEIGELCTIRPGAYIAPNAKLGRRVIVYPHVYVGKGAFIGDDCVLHPGVCVYDGCVLGNRVVLHANTVIGQDGFGYATARADGDDEVRHHKIPSTGNTVVEDDVEMGASCAVDRATLGSTVIGQGTRFSNHVVIGHGCSIGPHNLFVAGVGIAGSVTTGSHVSMGGQVGVAGHLNIGDRVKIAASSKVMHDVPADESWGGTPAQPLTQTKRMLLQQQRLPDMAAMLKRLDHRLSAIENQT